MLAVPRCRLGEVSQFQIELNCPQRERISRQVIKNLPEKISLFFWGGGGGFNKGIFKRLSSDGICWNRWSSRPHRLRIDKLTRESFLCFVFLSEQYDLFWYSIDVITLIWDGSDRNDFFPGCNHDHNILAFWQKRKKKEVIKMCIGRIIHKIRCDLSLMQ